jgi:hypothetical protein
MMRTKSLAGRESDRQLGGKQSACNDLEKKF